MIRLEVDTSQTSGLYNRNSTFVKLNYDNRGKLHSIEMYFPMTGVKDCLRHHIHVGYFEIIYCLNLNIIGALCGGLFNNYVTLRST